MESRSQSEWESEVKTREEKKKKKQSESAPGILTADFITALFIEIRRL